MTVGQWLTSARARLEDACDFDAKTDSSLFLCAVLGLERGQLRFISDRELTSSETDALEAMLSRRIEGEPEQYIEGAAYFMGLRFDIDPRALIPRFDTETLCEAAINELKTKTAPSVLDMCTGSGCILIATGKYCPGAVLTGCDISKGALELAERNALNNGVEAEFILSDGFAGLSGRKFDAILCNPPYLTRADMDARQAEVRYEPETALYGGEDGLGFYRRFAEEMRPHLADNAFALFEVGQGQAGDVMRIFACAYPKARIDTINDLNGVKRVVRMRF